MLRFSLLIFLSLLPACFLAACGQKQEPAAHGGQASPSSFSRLAWTAPEGWVEEEPASGLRVSQYRLPKAEGDPEDAVAYVAHFPGGGGTVEANLQRWYDQFIQPDGRPTKAVAKVNRTEHHGLQQTIVDVSGTFQQSTTPMGPVSEEKPGFRMLAAVIETPAEPWFVKLVGPEKTVERWKESFYKFTETFGPADDAPAD